MKASNDLIKKFGVDKIIHGLIAVSYTHLECGNVV